MERLRTVFDGMFDGVWLIGSDGLTTYTAMFAIKAQHRMQA
jgi:hypothetical protein